MTEYDTLRLERVARNPTVSIDDNSTTHYFDAICQTIYVAADNTLERAKPLGGRYIAEWINNIAAERSWLESRYTEQGLSSQLATAVAGDGR